MLTCKDITNLASDYIDKNLPPLAKMKVKMHLFMCHRCRNFVNQLNTTVNTLKNLKTPYPDNSFVEKKASELSEISKKLKSDKSQNKNS